MGKAVWSGTMITLRSRVIQKSLDPQPYAEKKLNGKVGKLPKPDNVLGCVYLKHE